jgi:hypothetical protein
VLGKSDGLEYNPFDHKLWALRDEDSNPALTLIDPKTLKQIDEAGKAEAEFRVPITTLREILEDGVTQEPTVVLEPGKGYNVVKPATATVKLKDL